MTDLYIIAAGKGSRMGSWVPKALIPIEDGIPNITNTLKQAEGLFERIFIVVNKDVRSVWDRYYLDNVAVYPELFATADANAKPLVQLVCISSGLGDGHAVLAALDELDGRNDNASDKMVVAWGDAFIQYRQTFEEILAISSSGGHLDDCPAFAPAVLEQDPYVSLLTDNEMRCTSADFSKYGEKHPTGLHDQSVFFFDKKALHEALRNLHCCFWKYGRYIAPGGELSLLYVFHYLHNTNMSAIIYQTDYPTRGFNTPMEVAEIQREIRKSW